MGCVLLTVACHKKTECASASLCVCSNLNTEHTNMTTSISIDSVYFVDF